MEVSLQVLLRNMKLLYAFVCSYLYGLLMDVIIEYNYVIIIGSIYIFFLYVTSCQNTDFPSTPTYPQQTYPPHQSYTIQCLVPTRICLIPTASCKDANYNLIACGYDCMIKDTCAIINYHVQYLILDAQ